MITQRFHHFITRQKEPKITLYPWRKEQGNGNAQLALEVRKL